MLITSPTVVVKKTLILRSLSNAGVVIVTPRLKNLGSLQVDALEDVRSDLESVVLHSGMGMILDLSPVEIYGAGFLRIIQQFSTQVRTREGRIWFCGDRTGLLALVSRGRWGCVLPDLHAALGASAAAGENAG